MTVDFGRDICGQLAQAEQREWLVTNGLGSYAAGTIAGLSTRRYHGYLIAALKPPLGRTLLLAHLDERISYGDRAYELSTHRWADGTVTPQGYRYIEHFYLDGTTPVWHFACADALLEKRLWMQPGADTTYIRYTVLRASQPLDLTIKALANYRDHHGSTQGGDWHMTIAPVDRGIKIAACAEATPFYLLAHGLAQSSRVEPAHQWYEGFDLAMERYRGLGARDDGLHVATFTAQLQPEQSFAIVVSTDPTPPANPDLAWAERQQYERDLLLRWQHSDTSRAPAWIDRLVLAADQFVVDRPIADTPDGKTVIAGYPWFGDWGRDTAIALPGLTLATGRPEVARQILLAFARYSDRGMLPNVFPEQGETPCYNTVDGALWYVEAARAYYAATGDADFLQAIFPTLTAMVDWHQRGTRYGIQLDPEDGLLYAGEPGSQLTWMDAKIGGWTITPRVGKPIEIQALWYNALRIVADWARILNRSDRDYLQLADRAAAGFQRFWYEEQGYCYDVLDTPEGDDATFRPNQIFAVSLPDRDTPYAPLLETSQRQTIVTAVARQLLTSYGLRSLNPEHPDYRGRYGGDPVQRDSSYHQGPAWGWLLGPFVRAYVQTGGNLAQARSLLAPVRHHLRDGCIGTLGEIFDGDPPFTPRGAFAQAWTVAEVLHTWHWLGRNESASE